MNREVLRDRIERVVARRNGQWDDPGEAWLAYRNPEDAVLLVDDLVDALVEELASEDPGPAGATP